MPKCKNILYILLSEAIIKCEGNGIPVQIVIFHFYMLQSRMDVRP